MDDGAVGGDGVLALLHDGQLAAAVVGTVRQAVDGAALGAGRDGHTGNGLGALHAVHRTGTSLQQVLLHLLEGENRQRCGATLIPGQWQHLDGGPIR